MNGEGKTAETAARRIGLGGLASFRLIFFSLGFHCALGCFQFTYLGSCNERNDTIFFSAGGSRLMAKNQLRNRRSQKPKPEEGKLSAGAIVLLVVGVLLAVAFAFMGMRL